MDLYTSVPAKHIGYVHTTAAAAFEGLVANPDAVGVTPELLSQLSYVIACKFVLHSGRVDATGIAGIPDGKLALVHKMAVSYVRAYCTQIAEDELVVDNFPSLADSVVQAAYKDVPCFVLEGETFHKAAIQGHYQLRY